MAINNFVCMGRLTADPELRSTQSGRSCTKFTIALDRDYKDDKGNRPADFANIVAWEKTAEFVCNYFKKGDMIAVAAEFRNNNWTDQNGQKRYDYYFEARKASFCGNAQTPAAQAPTAQQNPQNPQNYVPQAYMPQQTQPQGSYYGIQTPMPQAPNFQDVTDDSDLPF